MRRTGSKYSAFKRYGEWERDNKRREEKERKRLGLGPKVRKRDVVEELLTNPLPVKKQEVAPPKRKRQSEPFDPSKLSAEELAERRKKYLASIGKRK